MAHGIYLLVEPVLLSFTNGLDYSSILKIDVNVVIEYTSIKIKNKNTQTTINKSSLTDIHNSNKYIRLSL